MDQNELKMQALLDSISRISAEYENKIADLRVQLTVIQNDNQAVTEERNNLRSELSALQETANVQAQAGTTSNEEN